MLMATKARTFQLACRARASQPQALITSTPASASYFARSYATQTSSSSSSSSVPPRRSITVTTDDGRYDWSELSRTEKAARSTQQTVNFLLVTAGLTGTCLVSYFLYQELFAPDSKTVQFNHAVNRIKASDECRELLGPSRKIKAYGESTPGGSRWARARPLAYSAEVDRMGLKHVRMHFNVEGPKGQGVVNVHMTNTGHGGGLEYRLLSLNVVGHEVVYLENMAGEKGMKGKVGRMFGVQWR